MACKGEDKEQAFEVEDLERRENFVFHYLPERGGQVICIDSSRGGSREVKFAFEKDFPFDCKNAYDYFQHLYGKALRAEERVGFLGWVDTKTFEPIAPEQTYEEAMRGVPDKDPQSQEESL